MTNVKFHGVLGDKFGKNWNLQVGSVGEAIHAVNTKSRQQLYKFFHENDKKGLRYKVIINGEEFRTEKPLTLENVEDIKNSELAIKRPLKTVDFVPILEGAQDILTIVLGVILVVVGIVFSAALGPFSAAFIIGGIGLIAGGVINLLSSPPKFQDFASIVQKGGGISYLFSGPEQTQGEGNPVPLGYGRLIVGSHVISASYEVSNRDATLPQATITV